MKILVFGAGGQVGREICRAAWPPSFELVALDRRAADITDAVVVSAVIARERPDLIINLAAYTAVDRAESEREQAFAVNAQGAALKDLSLVCIVCAPEGVRAVESLDPGIKIYAAALDRELNARKYILPGLGDFGDRLYGT